MTKKIPASELILNPDGSIYHLHLKPEFLASSVITVGDPGRVAMVSQYFDEIKFQVANREFVTHTGIFKGKMISVISSGMGTDNIEILMNELDALVNVDLKRRQVKPMHTSLKVVRVGTSGSIRKEIPTGVILASEYGIGLDSLMQFYNLESNPKELSIAKAVKEKLGLGLSPYCCRASPHLLEKMIKGEVIKGNTVTCPGFFGPQGRGIRLQPAIPDIIERLTEWDLDGVSLSNFEMETAGYYAMGSLLGHEMMSLNAIVANRVSQTFAEDPKAIVDKAILHALENI
ncbi:nucleoside phosphorylase [Echinicola jeungdonensis]|uniref:Uridine phosphorylase n=1 Tax=Echinicola jeungdonensis TaxID=709343 RepID=A0ABV5J3D7_9BACT|nr:nucleoside phosphorylase [Echinicola jeungdonensis]MDN3669594.1 nucleoside phosphorylase [Echinicola jeungdonensis]